VTGYNQLPVDARYLAKHGKELMLRRRQWRERRSAATQQKLGGGAANGVRKTS
jgi:hypothetical protein